MNGEKPRYQLTEEYIETERGRLYRIKALKTIKVQGRVVHRGELGGYVASEHNLPQWENSWVFDNAKMYDNSRLWGNACLFDESSMFDNAQADYCSAMFGNSSMYDQTWLQTRSRMYGNSELHDHCEMNDESQIFNDVILRKRVALQGNAYVTKNEDILYFELPYVAITFYAEENETLSIGFLWDEKLDGFDRLSYSAREFERKFNCNIRLTEKGIV